MAHSSAWLYGASTWFRYQKRSISNDQEASKTYDKHVICQKGSLTYVRKSLPPLQHGKIADIQTVWTQCWWRYAHETANLLYQPVPKPRMTQRDAWKRPVVVKYHAFVTRWASRFTLPGKRCSPNVCYPMPKSWSKKKRIRWMVNPTSNVLMSITWLKPLWMPSLMKIAKYGISARQSFRVNRKDRVTLPENTENHELITIR